MTLFDEVETMMNHYEAIGISNDRDAVEEQLKELHEAGFIILNIKGLDRNDIDLILKLHQKLLVLSK